MPVIYPKQGYVKKGYSARINMLDWYEKDRESFDKVYPKCSLVEMAFSSMKKRLGSAVKTISNKGITVELGLRCISYNLIV